MDSDASGKTTKGLVIAALGQASWDILGVAALWPSPDSKEEILRWEEQGGGPAATALVTAARLGAEGRFAGVVGDDDAGAKIRTSLEAEGVATHGLVSRQGAASQTAFIVVEEGSGRRTIFWRRADGAELDPEEIPPGFLDGSNFLLLDGLMATASQAAAREARRRRIPVLLDAGRTRPGMLELAALSDYVIGGEQFFLDLGWDGRKETFREIASRVGSPVAGVTLGERGSLVAAGGDLIATPAFPVATVDTTGAGDVFHGALAFALAEGRELAEALRFASAAAGLKCRSIGGRAGIPTLKEIEALLAER